MVRRQPSSRAPVALPGLALHASAARAEALLKEREKLLRDVNKKKQQLEQAQAAVQREAESALSKMGPLIERHTELVTELAALFDELLAEGRVSARARKKVLQVRRSLELQGLLSPRAGIDDDRFASAGDPWDDGDSAQPGSRSVGAQRTAGKGGGRDRARGAADPSEREVASAPQPNQENRTLRDLFRNLARAVHPDHARHESERSRRTEVMKEVTRAYENGDFARLIELERAWQSERVLAGEGDPEQRCRELTRINRELLNQVRGLTRELRDVKREARQTSLGPIDRVIEEASRELDDLASVCEFVRKFRDGAITLAAFARGPMHGRRIADDEIAAVLESVLAGVDFQPEPAPERPRGKRQRG